MRVQADGLLVVEGARRRRDVVALAPDASWPTAVVGRVSSDETSALVGTEKHDALVWLSVRSEQPRRFTLGERLAYSERLAISPVSAGFLVLHERGLIRIDDTGRESWRVDRVAPDWRFVGERDDALWVADHDGNLLGFDLADGVERT